MHPSLIRSRCFLILPSLLGFGLFACVGGDTGLSGGPIVLGLTQDSASIWLRTNQPGEVRIEWNNINDSEDSGTVSSQSSMQSDLSSVLNLGGLLPDTCYEYEIQVGEVREPISDDLRFCTLSPTVASLKIGLLGDLDKRLSIEAAAIGMLADRQPNLLLLIGDWDHRDPISLEQFRLMHLENRTSRKLAARPLINRIFSRIPVAYVWDDHDYGENNSDRFSSTREQALRAYAEYWPTDDLPNAAAGIWRSLQYGDLVEVFMLDTRSQRDPDTYRDPRFVPDGEVGSNRGVLRNDPFRSMLDGAAQPEGLSTGQKSWLKVSLLTSPSIWKIIVSSVTWNNTTIKDDAWWDFQAERDEIVSFIRSNGITGIIFVSADIHTGGGIDDGTNADFPEVSIPSANLNPDENGRSTCAIHPSLERTLRTSCGLWSQGLHDHGSGYGLLTLDRDTAFIETVNLLGGVTSLSISRQ